jgi:hypothetical protein
MVSNAETQNVIAWGIVLPNETVHWHQYQGHQLDTAEGRQGLLTVLVNTARSLDFDVQTFLGHYKWTTRTETITVVASEPGSILELTDTSAYDPPVIQAGDDEGGDQGPDGSDSGAVQQGPVERTP